MSVRDEISKNLLYYRKSSGLTQKEFADKIGVKHSAVSNWERGMNCIDIETLYAACEALDVTITDMYGKYASVSDPEGEMTKEERELVDCYRSLSAQGQEYIRQQLDLASRVYKKCSDSSALETAE